MDQRRPEAPQGGFMERGRVAFVPREPVLGKNTVVTIQDSVPRHFGHDGGAGNGKDFGIAVNDRTVVKRQVAFEPVAVHQQTYFPMKTARFPSLNRQLADEGGNGVGHGQKGRL